MIVCDTGPLHYLVLIDCVPILPRLYGCVLTVPVVIHRELVDDAAPDLVRRWAAAPPSFSLIERS